LTFLFLLVHHFDSKKSEIEEKIQRDKGRVSKKKRIEKYICIPKRKEKRRKKKYRNI